MDVASESVGHALYADASFVGPKSVLYVDVVRVNPTCASYTNLAGDGLRGNANKEACTTAVERAIKYKHKKYANAVDMEGFINGGIEPSFKAFAVTSLGGLSKEADKTLKELASMAVDMGTLNEANKPGVLRGWRLMISCALWRGLGQIACNSRMSMAAALKWKVDASMDVRLMSGRGELNVKSSYSLRNTVEPTSSSWSSARHGAARGSRTAVGS